MGYGFVLVLAGICQIEKLSTGIFLALWVLPLVSCAVPLVSLYFSFSLREIDQVNRHAHTPPRTFLFSSLFLVFFTPIAALFLLCVPLRFAVCPYRFGVSAGHRFWPCASLFLLGLLWGPLWTIVGWGVSLSDFCAVFVLPQCLLFAVSHILPCTWSQEGRPAGARTRSPYPSEGKRLDCPSSGRCTKTLSC